MTFREGIVIAPLVACIIAIALYPALITDRGEAATQQAVARVASADCGAAAADAAADVPSGGYTLTFDDACASRYGLADEPEADNASAEGESGGEGAPEQELAAPGPGDEKTILGCAQDALAPNDAIDREALNQCLMDAGLDPEQTQIPAVVGG